MPASFCSTLVSVPDDDTYARDPTESQIHPRSEQYDPEQYNHEQYQQYQPQPSHQQYQPEPSQQQYQPEPSQHQYQLEPSQQQYQSESTEQQYQLEPNAPATSEALKAGESLPPPQPQSTEA